MLSSNLRINLTLEGPTFGSEGPNQLFGQTLEKRLCMFGSERPNFQTE